MRAPSSFDTLKTPRSHAASPELSTSRLSLRAEDQTPEPRCRGRPRVFSFHGLLVPLQGPSHSPRPKSWEAREQALDCRGTLATLAASTRSLHTRTRLALPFATLDPASSFRVTWEASCPGVCEEASVRQVPLRGPRRSGATLAWPSWGFRRQRTVSTDHPKTGINLTHRSSPV